MQWRYVAVNIGLFILAFGASASMLAAHGIISPLINTTVIYIVAGLFLIIPWFFSPNYVPPQINKSTIIVSCINLFLIALMLIISYYYKLPVPSPPKPDQAQCLSTNDSVINTIPFDNPNQTVGVSTTNTGEIIGISDGSYAFDTTRASKQQKIDAANSFRTHDTVNASNMWSTELATDTNDAETLIYQEDQNLDLHLPYVTFVVATMLSGSGSDIGTGRDNLQGAFVQQKEWNTAFGLHHTKMQVRLLIANSGSNPQCTIPVANQIVRATQRDKTIVGVMGWPFSAQTLNAVDVITNHDIPMVSPSASADDLSGRSPYFFRIDPPNTIQANVAAQYAVKVLRAKHILLIYDPKNSYSASLAKDFKTHFSPNDVVEKTYTVFRSETLPNITAILQQTKIKFDLIFLAGYASDANALLTKLPNTGPYAQLQVLGGEAFYELNGYTPDSRKNFSRLHFIAFAYPDEWDFLQLTQQKPAFFREYGDDFDPNTLHSNGDYGYRRADNDTILSYDTMKVLLIASDRAIINDTIMLSTHELQQALSQVNGINSIQGVGGQISFRTDGNPDNKAIVFLTVNAHGQIMLDITNNWSAVQGCFLTSACDS